MVSSLTFGLSNNERPIAVADSQLGRRGADPLFPLLLRPNKSLALMGAMFLEFILRFNPFPTDRRFELAVSLPFDDSDRLILSNVANQFACCSIPRV